MYDHKIPVAPLVLALLLSVTASIAQSSWQEHTDAGELAFAYGKLDRAERELRAALEIAKGLPAGDRRLETSLENLARVLEHQTRLDEAQPLYELLLAAREHRLGGNSPRLLDTLKAAGRVALGAGDIPTAEAHLRRFIRLADTTEDRRQVDRDDLRMVLGTLSRMSVLQERPEEALELQRRAVGLLEGSVLTPTERAAEMESLAQLELLHGSSERAEQLLLDAVALRAKDRDEGTAATTTAATMAAAAGTAFAAGELEIAERFANRALAASPGQTDRLAAQAVLADVSWMRVRRGCSSLGDLLLAAGDSAELAQAEQRLRELQLLQAQLLPADDVAVQETRSRLVQVLVLRGQPASAIELQQQVVAARRSAGGPALTMAINDLVDLLIAAGEQQAALAGIDELLQQLEASHGPDSPQLLPVLRRQLELLDGRRYRKQAKQVKKRIRKLEKALRR